MKDNFNKALYSESLFEEWAYKEDLDFSEKYFLNNYVQNHSKRVIEGGTGGGRIIFYLEQLGFTQLDAFDFVPKMIEYCKTKSKKNISNVQFKVADAINLKDYQKESFDYLIYLQQVLSFVNEEDFDQSLIEANRIGAKDSIYIFSFLNWHAKKYNPILSLLVNFFRWLRREKTSKYYLPWLIINRRFNWKLFHSNQASNLWIKRDDISNKLIKFGFEIIELKTECEIERNTKSKNSGKIYVACKKI